MKSLITNRHQVCSCSYAVLKESFLEDLCKLREITEDKPWLANYQMYEAKARQYI